MCMGLFLIPEKIQADGIEEMEFLGLSKKCIASQLVDILGFKKEVFQGSWFLILKFPGMKLSLLYSYLQEECHLVPEIQAI